MNVIDRDSLVGMVAGPLVWGAHFLTCYIAIAVACAFEFETGGPGEWGTVKTILLAVTGIALALIAVLILLAWHRWMQAGGFEKPRDSTQARHQFMAVGGLLLCFLSVVAVIYAAVPLFFLPACQ
ncbi:hypothetical protein [Chelativorans sp. YIM 93263]|uniref:hypothetical protein n=1 Tax=Chelativorans sp. YIM 93263 TaxID=2906648 RepID=UPI002378C83E|nr:hypothetical protein [Chelativorans sp. YIM 93263]